MKLVTKMPRRSEASPRPQPDAAGGRGLGEAPARTRAGRDERFAQLFLRDYAYVARTLRKLGVDARDVEDVAQDTLLTVYGKIDELDSARPSKPWLYAFALRAAQDYRKLARHRIEVMVDSDTASSSPTPEVALESAEASRLVARALGDLDVERRRVLVAFEVHATPMRDIASAMGIPLFTAYSRLRLARSDLRRALLAIKK